MAEVDVDERHDWGERVYALGSKEDGAKGNSSELA